MRLQGRAHAYGRDLEATTILSPEHDQLAMGRKWGECAKYILGGVDAGFISRVRHRDILVGSGNLGSGHAHYYSGAIMGAREAGVAGMFAESVDGLFQRAAIDFGMPVWAVPGLYAFVSTGDEFSLDLAEGQAINVTAGTCLAFKPVAPLILDILVAGGSRNWALARAGYPARTA